MLSASNLVEVRLKTPAFAGVFHGHWALARHLASSGVAIRMLSVSAIKIVAVRKTCRQETVVA
jgi:hypothetical protein